VRALILTACTLAALACGQPMFSPPPPRPPVIPREPYFAPPASAAEIASIGWGRGSCLGECPVYSATLHASGEARWRGTFPERYDGADTTTVDPATFTDLAGRILTSGFFEWERDQGRRIYDVPSLTISVALTDGRVKQVTGVEGLHVTLGWVFDSAAQTLPWRRACRPFEFYHRAMVWRSQKAAGQDTPSPYTPACVP
jgi:hypothetical protein